MAATAAGTQDTASIGTRTILAVGIPRGLGVAFPAQLFASPGTLAIVTRVELSFDSGHLVVHQQFFRYSSCPDYLRHELYPA